MRALLLPLGTDVYALEIARVREVLAAPPLTRVPGAPPAVRGLFNLHGEVLPALDLGVLLGLGGATAAAYVAVVETARGPAGLTTDALPQRATLGDPAGPADLSGTRGRYEASGRAATLLDLDELLAAAAVAP